MNYFLKKNPPKTKAQLLQRAQAIEGLSFAQLSTSLGIVIPSNPNRRKGWIGQAIELALGADGHNKAQPDFHDLGVELKTIPLSATHKPTESTFITSIPLLTIHQQTWKTSQCYGKLKCVLWVPVEGDRTIPYEHRRIGRACLWSPEPTQEGILEADWEYLVSQITTGNLEHLDARSGEYLQIRPKAANGKSLCYAFDFEGNKVQTLPRGFYLRSSFTSNVLTDLD